MSFSLLQKLVTYLLAGLGLLSLSFGGELPVAALLVLGVGFVASYFAEAPLIEKPWWSRAITSAVAAALVIQIARGVLEAGGWLGLAMEFSGLLTLSRLANRRTASDYQQIAMLAFIQLIAATVLTTDLTYAGVFVAFVIATPWVLSLAHLRREIERNYPAAADEQGSVDLQRVLASRRIVDVRFLLWTAWMSIPVLLMTGAVFALFPRIGLGMLNIGSNRGQHVTGFGSDVELGAFGVIRDDPTVVLRVIPPFPLTRAQERRVLRLRGTAFDRYDGKKWTRSSKESVRMSPIGQYYPLRRMEHDGDLTVRLLLERLDEPVLFVPTGAVGLRLPERGVPGAQTGRVVVSRGHGLDIRYAAPDELGVVYESVVSLQKSDLDVPVDRDLDDDRYLALPPGHERVIALARELTAGMENPADKVNRLQNYLRSEKRFSYTLDLPDPKGRAPLEAFLLVEKRGHCEYFSSALAIMLRAVGIPSRNVTGFLGGEYNRYGGYYGVRQSDAHSWVEALLPERGWVVLDPTPPSRDAYENADMFREVRAMLDAMRAYWMTRVVSYDLRKQIRALRELRDFFKDFGLWGSDKSEDSSEPSQDAKKLPRSAIAFGALGVIALLVAGAFALRRLRQRRSQRELRASAQKAQRLYRELEQALQRAGRARPTHVTPEQHARSLEESAFAGAAAVRELTEVYVEARYGGRELDLAELRRLRERLREVA